MKKMCICLLSCLLLCACAAQPQWETVSDGEAVSVLSVAERPYVISFGIPTDAVEESREEIDTRRLYIHQAGDYEITSHVIAAVSLDSALRQVSGFGEGKLTVIETTRFGLPEYQFAWSAATDEGSYVSRASLVQDGGYYYALVFSVKEGLGTTYNHCAEAVFASFGINGDEQF